MQKVGFVGSGRWWVGLLVLLFIVCLAGCGERATPAPEMTTTDDAEVGKTIEAEGWIVKLIEPPLQAPEVGSGTGDVYDQSAGEEGSEWGTRVADGIWLILPVEVTNQTGDMAFLPSKLPRVTDGQGREFELESRATHLPYVNASERWGKRENQLVQNVLDVGVTLEGPLIYDVAKDSTGLTLVMEGADETIDLGF